MGLRKCVILFLFVVMPTELCRATALGNAGGVDNQVTTPTPSDTGADANKIHQAGSDIQKPTGGAAVPAGAVSGIVAPGAHFALPGMGGKGYAVDLHRIDDPATIVGHLLGEGSQNSPGVKVDLPFKLTPGYYFFTLPDSHDAVIPGTIEVAPDKVKLISVHPSTAYPLRASQFNFDIIGENFSEDPKDDDVTIDGRGSIVKDWGTSEKDCESRKKPCLWVENVRMMHVVDYPAEDYQGLINIGVRVGTVTAADQKPLVLARFSGTVIFLLSAVVTGALFLIVSYIVGTGLAGNKVGRLKLNLLQTFIFDPETNSYSLSKFQLLVFSATFIFGYIYVLLSRWLVQWQFSLPDVPATIAGLLGISGGTTVASVGLTSARGPKGAGLQKPTGADLISSGGVVVPERFQFFVWTIVACGGFVALLIGQDPSKVSDFPEIPSGLLYVMGVSAAGYIAGKATRKPGPILEYVAVKKPSLQEKWSTLTVQGQNLASDGRFFIDEKELDNPTEDDRAKFSGLPDKLVTATPQMAASDTNFCSQLDIIIANSSIDLTQGDHRFRIVNRDGQFADISFSSSQPVIASVYETDNPPPADKPNTPTLRATDQRITAIVRGRNLPAGSSARWKAPGETSNFVDLAIAPGGPADGAELWLSMIPGLRIGSGQMNVITPSGFVACASVQVIPGPSQNGEQKPGVPSTGVGPKPVKSPATDATPVQTPPEGGDPNQQTGQPGQATQPGAIEQPKAGAGQTGQPAPSKGPEGVTGPGVAAPSQGPGQT
jgi:hypothetical protein